jgi:hypothetical protein
MSTGNEALDNGRIRGSSAPFEQSAGHGYTSGSTYRDDMLVTEMNHG